MTIKEFLTRYDNNEKFSEDELRDIYWGDLEEEEGDESQCVDEDYGDKGRWSRYETRYNCFNGRYFDCTADIGLTEYQDNYYDIQPVEVMRIKKIIEIDSWEPI